MKHPKEYSQLMPIISPDTIGLLFSSAMSIVLISLMLFMSYRLYRNHRKPAYRTLLISLIFILIQPMLQLANTLSFIPSVASLIFIGKLLQVYAYIVINFAIFELYHRRRPRTRMWFYGLLGTGFLITLGDVLPASASVMWNNMITTPALDIYLLILTPLFVLMFASQVGQPRKFMASLIIAFSLQISHLSLTYWYPESAILITMVTLLPVVYYIIIFLLLFERVVEVLQSIYRSSITDGLTNLFNRRYFMSKLNQCLRAGRSMGVIFCDIDNFKRLNDTHGHHKADQVLKQVATIVLEETDSVGLAGRYGGEELVAFVMGSKLTTEQTAEAIRQRTEKETMVTISVGYSMAKQDDTAEIVMKQADQAMYHSKTTGKNRVTNHASL
jgi:diguanylate cyclase (GGDEF)-like protein